MGDLASRTLVLRTLSISYWFLTNIRVVPTHAETQRIQSDTLTDRRRLEEIRETQFSESDTQRYRARDTHTDRDTHDI